MQRTHLVENGDQPCLRAQAHKHTLLFLLRTSFSSHFCLRVSLFGNRRVSSDAHNPTNLVSAEFIFGVERWRPV